jgi:hypothetical protein
LVQISAAEDGYLMGIPQTKKPRLQGGTMTTLHELLKRDDAEDRAHTPPRVDLRGRYSPIGISAVAAACRYSHDTKEQSARRGEDRSRTRG